VTRASRQSQALIALGSALVLLGSPQVPAHAAPGPTVKLLSASPKVTLLRRHADQRVPLDIGVYVASIGAPLEIICQSLHGRG